ncbi:MAG: endopeptidase La [Deltaproteobacteria bacterium RIFOXYD12_FULL_57_12]|nr:MAG: endopeptidase La [Deltaproteobacteria bacterium RIFOXYD12_FULL_57_12]
MRFFKNSEEKVQAATVDELQDMIRSARLPEHVRRIAQNETDLLAKISPASSEYTISFTYINFLLTIPWDKKTPDSLDLELAERILDEYHYGLHKTKARILEHLAVRILRLGERPRILVVDDEEVARRNLSHILQKEDYEVEVAVDGEDACRKLETTQFDVVFCDLKMPKVSGLDVLEQTRIKCPDTPVVIITGFASVDTAVQSLRKGAYHYIAKPFKLDEVRATAREALMKKAARRETKGSVLCFAGPPGTGKTSLGRSIAHALGRKFVRISLGGMKDEAELMGHRRTYAGARPGRIIEEIRRAESANPVIILDEIDKIGKDFKGDPAAALLEVLDSEQNAAFVDRYLDIPFDLSGVLFILTANVVDNILEPLLDRTELIEFTGYTEEEKFQIASRFLIPKQIRETGLSGYPTRIAPEAIYRIIQSYTREAGIRNLERQIATVCRKIAKGFVSTRERSGTVEVAAASLEKYLGPRRYSFEVAEENGRVGVTTGLVWTEVGGDIIFIETAKMKGGKELILTGSLGEVMRESAQTALSYVRSNASSIGIAEDFFEHYDLHVHVPAGAIPKDGPSSGAAIALALISLLTGRTTRRDVAMTGELTLTGRILPVGGVKEKILAARRSGIRTVILPGRNSVDLDDIPLQILEDITIQWVDRIDEMVDAVLMP